MFLGVNGSGSLSNAFVHRSFEALMNTHAVANAVFDEPGVRAPFGDPAAVRRDDPLFQRYTLGHGVACATEALRWAAAQFRPAVRRPTGTRGGKHARNVERTRQPAPGRSTAAPTRWRSSSSGPDGTA